MAKQGAGLEANLGQRYVYIFYLYCVFNFYIYYNKEYTLKKMLLEAVNHKLWVP